MSSQQPLHIALFIDDFYPASGGIGRSMQTQIGELVRLGHKVTLFVPKHQLQEPDNCEVFVTPSWYLPGTPAHMCSLHSNARLAQRIASTHQFDAVHSQTERGALVLAARIAKLQNIPHTHTFHANIAGTHAELPILSLFSSAAYRFVIAPSLIRAAPTRRSEKILLSPAQSGEPWASRVDWRSLASIAAHVDAFVTPSHFMMHGITACLPTEYKSNGHVIPTGVNPAFADYLETAPKTAKDGRPLRFLSVGRLAKEKRVDAIVEAFLQANLQNAELHIVGSGDQLTTLKKLASKSDAIYFHPHTRKLGDVARHYLDADVFILGSYGFDNQPITLIEAAAAGLPIVYCDPRLTVGVTAKNSILAASPGVADIAKALTDLAHPELRKRLAIASRKEAKNLSATTMAERHVELYRS